MRITHLNTEPAESFPYLNVETGGRDLQGERTLSEVPLPILIGTISDLPSGIDALVITSDLQGTVKNGDQEYLLGEVLPEFLSLFLSMEYPQLDQQKMVVALCGDLYATSEKRGGLGDVKNVWRAFRQQFGAVVGVAGNHDDFGEKASFEAFKRESGIHHLHGQLAKVQGMHVGGIGGIIGKPTKPQRTEQDEYLKMLKEILLKQPDFLLMHQGPKGALSLQNGHLEISQTILHSPPNLVICGHAHWENPLSELENGTQVLNVDGRVVVLLRE